MPTPQGQKAHAAAVAAQKAASVRASGGGPAGKPQQTSKSATKLPKGSMKPSGAANLAVNLMRVLPAGTDRAAAALNPTLTHSYSSQVRGLANPNIPTGLAQTGDVASPYAAQMQAQYALALGRAQQMGMAAYQGAMGKHNDPMKALSAYNDAAKKELAGAYQDETTRANAYAGTKYYEDQQQAALDAQNAYYDQQLQQGYNPDDMMSAMGDIYQSMGQAGKYMGNPAVQKAFATQMAALPAMLKMQNAAKVQAARLGGAPTPAAIPKIQDPVLATQQALNNSQAAAQGQQSASGGGIGGNPATGGVPTSGAGIDFSNPTYQTGQYDPTGIFGPQTTQ